MNARYKTDTRLHVGVLYLQLASTFSDDALRRLGGRFMEFGHVYRLDLNKIHPTIDQPILARLDTFSVGGLAVFETLASGPHINERFNLGAHELNEATWEEVTPEYLPCYVHYPEKTPAFDRMLMGVPA